MSEPPNPLDALEARIDQLRQAVRAAIAEQDAERAASLREELRRTQRAWDALVSPPETDEQLVALGSSASSAWTAHTAPAAAMLPAREMVHRVLMLLQVPASSKLITEVHAAFFPEALPSSRLSSLRRDEERSYKAAPNSRPYYLVPALTYDLLAPARGLVTISTWPMERRMIGPLSPRADFLTATIKVAGAVGTPPGTGATTATPAARRLLARFALNIPGATLPGRGDADPDPTLVAAAAQAELDLHVEADLDERRASAKRARRQLNDYQQLFGVRLAGAISEAADG